MYELWRVRDENGVTVVEHWGHFRAVAIAQRAAHMVGPGSYVVTDAEGTEYAYPVVPSSGVAA